MSTNDDNWRSWMYNDRWDSSTGRHNEDFAVGLTEFMRFATNQDICLQSGKLFCPCPRCDNNKFITVSKVWNHLSSRGFRPNYKVWYCHGENDYMNVGSTSEYMAERLEEPRMVERLEEPRMVEENVGTVQMVHDAFMENSHMFPEEGNRVEEPNLEASRFFTMLDASKQPLYAGCKPGHSPLYVATRLMNFKTDYNLPEDLVDGFADFVNEILPEDNLAPTTFSAVEKLVSGLGLPYQMIDVCIDNCMIYWKEDAKFLACRFCGKPRFQNTGGRVRVAFKRMWYLPLADRLKRLYQSERTARAMRWHQDHSSDGEIAHPSDAEAWKHFQTVYPSFASESRNVYLGLSTDGFNPFGRHGRQYSLWPVIVTPYNLPPSLCMKWEFLFLTVLVSGPEHPKRSLDVFLQPLIHELQELWNHGVQAFDVSCQQNFVMRAVLMWTISDFPAYGMLSGWTTHGRLSCPYCQDDTNAFQLKHGQKTCWFDSHRRFLPASHPYRYKESWFLKNKVVYDTPPPEVDGLDILEELEDVGAERTAECGGNGYSRVNGYGDYHNWHKRSIFWDLPYWKDHLLRHNLDVMHIEKNFFDNIMNAVLNVQGKTKDNLKSRLDLPLFCVRNALHVLPNGKSPFPAFRLDGEAKTEFFQWIIHSVKFPDGYASNLRNCVDSREGRLSRMKSHDCHVFMQRLLPFAFAKLLPEHVHEAIAGDVEPSMEETSLVHLGEEATNDLFNDSEEESGEFEDGTDSAPSEIYSSDSEDLC
ncbi:unnamed protein product [Microthlaspi erraticum]|uniref:Transposase-associated domain-containing protein n=1 Tax=Microthlaspi erraticum TaxID=1685480 RepID=A0A6D2IXG5_9BRAS|nr:unnamed protein product [Microthlaspi erraticum]